LTRSGVCLFGFDVLLLSAGFTGLGFVVAVCEYGGQDVACEDELFKEVYAEELKISSVNLTGSVGVDAADQVV